MDQSLVFSQGCLDLLIEVEGYRENPYPDPASGGEPITIGIGSTHLCDGTKVTMQTPPMTQEEAEQTALCFLNNTVLPAVHNSVKANINQNMLNSLGVFIFNVGVQGFLTSHVLRYINIESTPPVIKQAWLMWDKAAGQVNQGLINRRNKEIALFYTPVE